MEASSVLSKRTKEKEFIVIGDQIGEGTFGRVEKCMRKEDERIVAVKTIAKLIEADLIR